MRSHRHWGRGTLGLLLFFRGGGRGANVNVGRGERGGDGGERVGVGHT